MRIGTRGSALALWQARTVAALLESSGTRVEIVPISTAGDRRQQAPLAEAGGKGLFVKEIEDALLEGTIDAAVHSAKDMSAVLPAGLEVAAALPREDPRDVLVLPAGTPAGSFERAIARLGHAPALGTGSIRRIAQLTGRLPTATFQPIRGNVDTRLRKLDSGEFHALVLAAAGLRRLGLASRISAEIPIDVCVPAPGQGIVAIEVRSDDRRTRELLGSAGDEAAAVALSAERAVVAALGGGCQLPLGAFAMVEAGALRVVGVVASPDGRRTIRRESAGRVDDPVGAGATLAADLVRAGAGEILDGVRP